MASINKLAIMGIRSFSADHTEVIEYPSTNLPYLLKVYSSVDFDRRSQRLRQDRIHDSLVYINTRRS